MDAILLDTDVFSYLNKGDSRAELYRPHVKGKTVALSFISVGELYFWTVKRKWSPKNIASLEQRIRASVIVPYDVELCKEFARVKLSLEGRLVPANDLWIATCAIRHSIPLVTHNRKHFEGIPRLNIISVADKLPALETGRLFALPPAPPDDAES
jgi:predicted nucleic acid-binding protein